MKRGKAFLFILLAFSLTSCDGILDVLKDGDIVAGLKEALNVGTDAAVTQLSSQGGYSTDLSVKILLPEEARTTFEAIEAIYAVPAVRTVMVAAGMELTTTFENVLVTAFNEAAEHAAPQAKDIFVSAITGMSISDGKQILFSDNQRAATDYLITTTKDGLTTAFGKVITNSLDQVSVANFTTIPQAWTFLIEQNNNLAAFAATPAVQTALTLASLTNDTGVNKIISAINAIKPLETDLGKYVTGKALDGLFTKVGDAETKIRTDASARVSKLLQDVFGQLDNPQ